MALSLVGGAIISSSDLRLDSVFLYIISLFRLEHVVSHKEQSERRTESLI